MFGSFWLYPVLFLTGLVAGVVDSIAGGGGLITLPVALAVGMPPKIALGTNKFQSSFGSFTATYYYVKHGIVSLRGARLGIVFTLLGAAAGAWGVQQIEFRYPESRYSISSSRHCHLHASHSKIRRC